MFCGKCGVKNADDAQSCTGCGAKLNGGQLANNSTSTVARPGNKNKKVGIIAVAVIAVVVIALIIGIFGGRGYKSTVNKFLDATYNSADCKAMFKQMPDEVTDYVLEDAGYEDDELKLFIEEMNEELQDSLDYYEEYFGEDWSVSWEILSVEDVTGRDMKDLRDDYEDEDIDIEISAAKTVEVEVTITGEYGEVSNSIEIPVIKVGRSWYIDGISIGGVF